MSFLKNDPQSNAKIKELPVKYTFQQALQNLPQQLALQDRFGILIEFKHTNFIPAPPESLYVFCQSISLPPTTLAMKQLRWDEGPFFSRPQGIDFGGEGIAVDFILDSDMLIKHFFDAWINVIFDTGSASMTFPEHYMHKIYLFNLDSMDNMRYIIELDDAFPRSLGMVSFTQAGQNTPASLTVTFTFHQMYVHLGEDAAELLKKYKPGGGVRNMEEGEFPGKVINEEWYQGGWDPNDPRVGRQDSSLMKKAISFFASLNPTAYNILQNVPIIRTMRG